MNTPTARTPPTERASAKDAPATAIVVAAGRGERLGEPAKILLPLAGRPMLAHDLDALEQATSVAAVVVVVAAHTRTAVEALVAAAPHRGWSKVRAIVDGGERRQDSVLAGLAAVDSDTEIVVVHDGARPLATPDLFDRCVAAAVASGAAIAAVPVADTLKRVASEQIVATVDRTGLWSGADAAGVPSRAIVRHNESRWRTARRHRRGRSMRGARHPGHDRARFAGQSQSNPSGRRRGRRRAAASAEDRTVGT